MRRGTPLFLLLTACLEPAAVLESSPCLQAPNVLHLEGDSWLVRGDQTVTDAEWKPTTNFSRIQLDVTPAAGGFWSVLFESPTGALQPSTYEQAIYPSDGIHPAIAISNLTRSCTLGTGRFRVDQVAYDFDGTLASLTAAFEYRCGQEPNAEPEPLLGCLHYDRASP